MSHETKSVFPEWPGLKCPIAKCCGVRCKSGTCDVCGDWRSNLTVPPPERTLPDKYAGAIDSMYQGFSVDIETVRPKGDPLLTHVDRDIEFCQNSYPSGPFWPSAQHGPMPIKDMDDGHLVNAVRMLMHRFKEKARMTPSLEGSEVSCVFPVFADLANEVRERGLEDSVHAPGDQSNRTPRGSGSNTTLGRRKEQFFARPIESWHYETDLRTSERELVISFKDGGSMRTRGEAAISSAYNCFELCGERDASRPVSIHMSAKDRARMETKAIESDIKDAEAHGLYTDMSAIVKGSDPYKVAIKRWEDHEQIALTDEERKFVRQIMKMLMFGLMACEDDMCDRTAQIAVNMLPGCHELSSTKGKLAGWVDYAFAEAPLCLVRHSDQRWQVHAKDEVAIGLGHVTEQAAESFRQWLLTQCRARVENSSTFPGAAKDMTPPEVLKRRAPERKRVGGDQDWD